MVEAVLRFKGLRFSPLRAVEVFPTSLSVVRVAGLERELTPDVVRRLQQVERHLSKEVNFRSILLARSGQELEEALVVGLDTAFADYVKSGTIVWRAVNHDYSKLLRLSAESRKAIEETLFRGYRKLERDTLVKAIAAIRTLGRIGEWVAKVEESQQAEKRELPIRYLSYLMIATFITQCLLVYVTRESPRAKKANLKELAKWLVETAEEEYRSSLQQKLPEWAGEKQSWYWSPRWQDGEAEADLDRRRGHVRIFKSAEQLVQSLKNS